MHACMFDIYLHACMHIDNLGFISYSTSVLFNRLFYRFNTLPAYYSQNVLLEEVTASEIVFCRIEVGSVEVILYF